MLNNQSISAQNEQLLSREMQIGGLTVKNRAFLAPMSGVSDVPFRNLAHEFGAGLVFSEMIASKDLINDKAEANLKSQRGNCPIQVVQLAGCETQWMALGAKMVEANGAQMVDINMGCPSKRVTTGQSGSALMRDLDHAQKLIAAVVDSVDIPVSLKMRLGWDDNTINAPELARRAQSCGIQMISVHGRTRCQFYNGSSDWQKVYSVKAAVNIPVVVNGDISCRNSAMEALKQSNADAVMLGRSTYGNPWLPGEIANSNTKASNPSKLTLELVQRHYEDILVYYGAVPGIRRARKHLKDYFSQLNTSNPHARNLSRNILTSENPDNIPAMIRELFSISNCESEAA